MVAGLDFADNLVRSRLLFARIEHILITKKQDNHEIKYGVFEINDSPLGFKIYFDRNLQEVFSKTCLKRPTRENIPISIRIASTFMSFSIYGISLSSILQLLLTAIFYRSN